MGSTKQYREMLGVPENASVDEIRRAYRILARKNHPDKNPSPDAATIFNELTKAYHVLYDVARARKDATTPQDGTTRGLKKGADITVVLDTSLTDIANCTVKPIAYHRISPCPQCSGAGSKSGADNCAMCGGTGWQGMSVLLGQKKGCLYCGGTGRIPHEPKCGACKGTGRVKVKARHDVSLNPRSDMVVLRGQGHYPVGAGGPGDLTVEIHITPHKRFRKEGLDLLTIIKTSPAQAAIGDTVELDVLGRPVVIRIPAGTQHGEEIHMEGEGLNHDGKKGRLKCGIHVVIPKIIPAVEAELYRKLLKEEKSASPIILF